MSFFGTPPPSPVKTTTDTHAPSAPNQRKNKNIDDMDNLIAELSEGKYNERFLSFVDRPISTFQGKLQKGETKELKRENQNPTIRVYIDNATQNPRLVYKISYISTIEREINAYEALEKRDVKRTHILKRVGGPIVLNEKFGMFITEWKEGLEPENLIWTNITQAENDEKKTEAKRLHGLEKEATTYLENAGVEHKDIAGNLYEVGLGPGLESGFFWIDFEQSEVEVLQAVREAPSKTSLFGPDSISPFSSPDKRPGLFGDSYDENESPNKIPIKKGRPNSLFTDSDDDAKGGKSRNKKSRKNKKHKRKSKSNKRKSNKRKTKSHKRK